jgi:16S rRNA (guanine527-N7)-methyltransferase
MELILKYFHDLTGLQKGQIEKLGSLYSEWNTKINVISRKDIDQLYLRHVLHSLSIAKYISFRKDSEIMDVGTGGGFPGLPLAIIFPDSNFLLVDSVGKKIKVVQAIIDDLGLKNCQAKQSRCEGIDGKFDFIISRAVAPLSELAGWVRNMISKENKHDLPNGILCLKGGDLTDEIKIPYQVQITDIKQYFDDPFFESKKIVHVIMNRKNIHQLQPVH